MNSWSGPHFFIELVHHRTFRWTAICGCWETPSP
jgi:hypothetical protein